MQINSKFTDVAATALLVALTTVLVAPLVYAASDDERATARQARQAEWKSLTSEEKKARRQQRQAHFEALPEDEKQAIRERRKQPRAGRRGNGGQHKRPAQRPGSNPG